MTGTRNPYGKTACDARIVRVDSIREWFNEADAGETLITGSFNFSKSAEEHNAENLLVIDDSDLAAKYAANWKSHLAHSMAYAGR